MLASAKSLRRIHLRNAAQAKNATAGRGRKRIPRPIRPDAIERQYVQALRSVAQSMADVYRRALLPRLPQLVREADLAHERTDAYTDTLDEILRQILLAIGNITDQPAVKSQARQIFDRVNNLAKTQVDEQVKVIAGIPIASVLPGGEEREAAFVSQNVSLIKSIGQTQHEQVAAIVRDGLSRGLRPEALATDIQERFGVAQSRAEFIARDQVLKTYGQVTEARHLSLGITKFIWRTSGDERVRGRPGGKYPKAKHDHWALEGQSFEYGSAPFGGPGRDYQCRCTAEPDVSAILGDES